MAYRRRPRTKVYDCNFNIGESYYRPVMESLDRKHSGRVDPVTPLGERESTPSGRLSKLLGERDHEGTPSSRASKLFADLETNGVDLSSKSRGSARPIDDEDAAIDAEFEETLKRIKQARAQRNADLEEEFSSYASKKNIDISDKLLDSVGINNKTQKALEDDVFFKRKSAKKRYDDEDDGAMMKWTAVRPGARALQDAEEAAEESGAIARARKSRARIQDIDTELEELAAKGAARQKRIQDLRALMAEDDSSSSATSSVKVTKRISVKSSSERKQVSF